MLFLNKDSQIRVCLQIQNRAFNAVLYFNISFLGLYIFILYIYIYISTTLPYIPSPLVKNIKALSLITY